LVAGFGSFVSTRAADNLAWQPWTAAAVEKAAPTANGFCRLHRDWCLTARPTKEPHRNPSVRAKLKQTQCRDVAGRYIPRRCRHHRGAEAVSRAVVPLVLVYPKDPKEPPIVLPELLTPGIVLNALEKAAGNAAKGFTRKPDEQTKRDLAGQETLNHNSYTRPDISAQDARRRLTLCATRW